MMQDLQESTRQRLNVNAFMNHNFIELEIIEPDHAVFRLNIRQESKNPMGIVHGGAIYTMADNAAGAAAHSNGGLYVTQSSSMNFLSNQSEGVFRSEAYVRRRGRSTCLVNVDITGDNQQLIATGTFTFFRLDGKN